MDFHAGVVPELGHQLAVPDVDSHHVRRAAPQQHISEAAGGGSGVQAPFARDGDGGKSVQRAGEFVAGPADVAVLLRSCSTARSLPSSTWREALASTWPAELTLPSAIRAAACVRDRARPRGNQCLVEPGHAQAPAASRPEASSFRASSRASWSSL